MNQSDLELIEKELDIKLPDDYKELMRDYPFENGNFKLVENDLLNDCEKIIEINLLFRKKGYKRKKWPNVFFIINLAIDDIKFMNLDNQDRNVYTLTSNDRKGFHPNNLEKHVLSWDIREYVEMLKVLQRINDNP